MKVKHSLLNHRPLFSKWHCFSGAQLIGNAVIPQINMSYAKTYLILLSIIFLIIQCSQPNDVEDKKAAMKYAIPDSIIKKMNNVILSKVGQKFFDNYIKFDSSRSRFSQPDSFCIKNPSRCSDFLLKPHFYLEYNFVIPENKYLDTYIEFVTDTTGKVVKDREVWGIPECPNNDCWERFPLISKEKAIQIAQENNLEQGIKEWQIKLHYYGGALKDYVWEILSTLLEEKYHSRGNGLLINASDGSIFESFGWETLAN